MKRPKRIVTSLGKESETTSKNGTLMSTKAYKQITGNNEAFTPVSASTAVNSTNRKGAKLVTKISKKIVNVPGAKHGLN